MDFIFLIGRILFTIIFIFAGTNHLIGFAQTAETVKKFGAPFPRLSALVMSLLAIFGGLSVAIGFHAKVGAVLLIIFLLPTTFIAHRFWGLGDKQQLQMQRVNFLKNLSLIGVTLMIMYFGSGPLSWR